MGNNSKAIAYVDNIVRRWTKGRLQDIAYISAMIGNFTVGEKIVPTDGSVPLDQCPVLTGSLNEVTFGVFGSGQNYANGDIVDISSDFGDGAQGIVTETFDQFGIVDSIFHDNIGGGYGYNTTVANNIIYISDSAVTISDVQVVNTGIIQHFQQFDIFTQTQAYINYRLANGNIVVFDTIFTYNGTGDVVGIGSVLTKTAIDSNT